MGLPNTPGLSLSLESDHDSLRLDSWLQSRYGNGVQALKGVSGFGLPMQVNQWFEGVGDGSVYLGTRFLSRQIRLPLHIEGPDRLRLREYMQRIGLIFEAGARLVVLEPSGERWTLPVVREQGGDFEAGGAQTDMRTRLRPDTLVLRSPDAYWTRDQSASFLVRTADGGGLLPHLTRLNLTSSQTLGTYTVDNPGDARAYPLWRVNGPSDEFVATSERGEILAWSGTLLEGEWVEIDTQAGTAVYQDGRNAYGGLAPAPQMWTFPPGRTSVTISLNNTTPVSSVQCFWKPQRKVIL